MNKLELEESDLSLDMCIKKDGSVGTVSDVMAGDYTPVNELSEEDLRRLAIAVFNSLPKTSLAGEALDLMSVEQEANLRSHIGEKFVHAIKELVSYYEKMLSDNPIQSS